MKATTVLLTDIRNKRGKIYTRAKKTRSHRCERRKLREVIHRWDPELEDPVD